MSSKEKLKCKTVKSVLRYHVPNLHKQPENYAHHMLFMFYPFRKNQTCVQWKVAHTWKNVVIKNIVNENKQTFEPFSELVDSALTDYRTDLTRNPDAFAQQENDEVSAMMEPETDDPEENEAPLFQELG